MKKLHIAQTGYILVSFAFYAAAVLYLFFPHLPPLVISIFSGVTLLAYGIIKIVAYFSEDLFCLAFRYDLGFGLLLLAIGAILLIRHTRDTSYLPSGIGWLSVLDSFLKIQMSEEAKKFGLKQWNIIFTTAVITGVLGIILILKGSTKPGSTRILTSAVLLATGIMNHCVVKFAVKRPGHQQPVSQHQKIDKGESS